MRRRHDRGYSAPPISQGWPNYPSSRERASGERSFRANYHNASRLAPPAESGRERERSLALLTRVGARGSFHLDARIPSAGWIDGCER